MGEDEKKTMLLVDYHLIFIIFSFLLFIITIFLLFIDTTMDKTVGAIITLMMNLVVCAVVILSFHGVDMISYDSAGTVIHTANTEMGDFNALFFGIAYVNIMLFVYASYLLAKKPWDKKEENDGEEDEWNLYPVY